MKRVLLVVGPFLVTLAVALWFLGVFEPRPGVAPPATPAPTPAEPPSDAPPAPARDLAGAEPLLEPKPESPVLEKPVRVLVLGERMLPFYVWLHQTWGGTENVEWRSWYATPLPEGSPRATEGVAPLEQAPAAADLDAVDVLVLAGFDPARLGADVWARVAERVQGGRMGLLVLPDFAHASALAAEPSLSGLVPVRGVKELKPATAGGPLPGVFSSARPFRVTEEGTKHPATRIVPFPGWSEKIWKKRTEGEGAWKTPFVPVVDGPAAGATVLLEVVGGDRAHPAVVASSGAPARVLWVAGLVDLDWDAYRKAVTLDPLVALARWWVAWLAPR